MVRVAEAVQRRGYAAVELTEAARRPYLGRVVDAGKQLQLGERFRLQRGQEVARVDQAVQPAVERVAGGAQVDRRRHRSGASHDGQRFGAALAKPLQKRVAAEGDADGMERYAEASQHPVDLF